MMLLALALAASTPTALDVAAVEQFVRDDKSYAPAAKAEALRQVAQLPTHLGDAAKFELEAARIVALADNGHSAFFPAQWTLRYPRSPMRFGLFADGLYVIAAPPEHRRLLGKPVTQINGRNWRDVRQALAKYQGGTQSFRDQFLPYFIETPAIMVAAGLGTDRSRLRIKLADEPTLVVTAKMSPLDGEAAFLGESTVRDSAPLIKGSLPLYLREADKLYVSLPLAALDARYVRIDAIGGDGLKPFLTRTLAELKAGKQRNIILDLRFNMGGDLNRARDFAEALPALAKGGRVYAITSGRTFSAAISTIGYLKQAAPAKVTIVGEAVGDRLEFWAEGGMRELPMGAKLLLATERHNYRTGCPEADCHASIRDHPIRVASVQPDLPAPLRFVDFRAGRDPAMEAIARDIRRRGRQR